jgi:hypothetical protein
MTQSFAALHGNKLLPSSSEPTVWARPPRRLHYETELATLGEGNRGGTAQANGVEDFFRHRGPAIVLYESAGPG